MKFLFTVQKVDTFGIPTEKQNQQKLRKMKIKIRMNTNQPELEIKMCKS